jgi:hypothetical protein
MKIYISLKVLIELENSHVEYQMSVQLRNYSLLSTFTSAHIRTHFNYLPRLMKINNIDGPLKVIMINAYGAFFLREKN